MRFNLHMASGFLCHRLHALSRFDLHSPFLYKLYKEILCDNKKYDEYLTAEKIRAAMLQNPGSIIKTDFGTGSEDHGMVQRKVAIRDVVRYSGVNRKTGELLFRMSRHLCPGTILELGTSLGISTAYLALGNPSASVYTIEGCTETAKLASENFANSGLNHIHTVTGNFDDVLPEILKQCGILKMVFIDGNHRKEPTMKYFSLLLQYIADDSVFILDDIHWSKEMEMAWREISQHPSVKVTVDLFSTGLVFFSERLSKQDFILAF
jgi:predicted O-methyltransferase YrrM